MYCVQMLISYLGRRIFNLDEAYDKGNNWLSRGGMSKRKRKKPKKKKKKKKKNKRKDACARAGCPYCRAACGRRRRRYNWLSNFPVNMLEDYPANFESANLIYY